MADQKSRQTLPSKSGAVILAGLLSAVACFLLLPAYLERTEAANQADSAFNPTLKQVKKLQKIGKWQESAQLLETHVTPKHPHALLEYGKLLSHGWGIPRDLEKAREKLLIAVQHDFDKRGEAAFELGKVYRQSTGEDCNRIAFEWFSKSAAWGFGKAQGELGRHYARGIGVPVNPGRALEHFQIAAQYGSATALVSFLRLAAENPSLGSHLPPLTQLVADGISSLEKEASQGKASAAKALGRLYLDERLVARDPALARRWLRRGADLGDSGAMTELALLILEGLPSDTDIKEGLVLMRQAVKLNNAGAITELGRLHLAGKFGLNKADAIALFDRGLQAAHPGAMLELARLHLDGQIVEKDPLRARTLLKQAAKLGHEGSSSLLQKIEAKSSPKTKKGNALPEAIAAFAKESDFDSLSDELADPLPQTSAPNAFPLSGATIITPFGGKG